MALYHACKPTHDGLVESFNSPMRDKLLNETLFFTISHPYDVERATDLHINWSQALMEKAQLAPTTAAHLRSRP